MRHLDEMKGAAMFGESDTRGGECADSNAGKHIAEAWKV